MNIERFHKVRLETIRSLSRNVFRGVKMCTADDFLTKFHNLEGVSIGERKRSLFKLLNDYDALNKDTPTLDRIATSLTPKTYLEGLFRIDVLLYFRRIPELLAIFKNGDERHTLKIMKHSWFFKEAFSDMTGQEFADEVLPFLSYSIRVKTFRKLRLFLGDQDKLEVIYNIVKERYGIDSATIILLGCRHAFVGEQISTECINFRAGQLRELIKISSDFLLDYLSLRKPHEVNDILTVSLLNYIASTQIGIGFTIYYKYGLIGQVGRKGTKYLFRTRREDILSDVEGYAKVLNKGVLVRELAFRNEFTEFLKQQFPESASDFSYYKIKCWLDKFPKKRRYDLLASLYKSVYKKRIYDYFSLACEPLLDLIKDKNNRAEVVEKMAERSLNVAYLAYGDTKNAIEFYKREIDNVLGNERDQVYYVDLMVKSCVINEDLGALVAVGKYVEKEFSKQWLVQAAYIAQIARRFDIRKANDELWDIIKDFISRIQHLDECYCSAKLIRDYVKYCYRKGISCVETIMGLLLAVGDLSMLRPSKKEDTAYYTKLMTDISDHLSEHEESEHVVINFCRELYVWDRKHPDNKIQLKDTGKFVKYFIGMIRSGIDISFVLRKKDKLPHEKEIADYYWNSSNYLNSYLPLVWSMRNEPLLLQKNLDKVIRFMSDSSRIGNVTHRMKCWHLLRLYDHLNFREEAVEYCKKELANNSVNTTYLFEGITTLVQPWEYAVFEESCKPEVLKINIFDKKMDLLKTVKRNFSPVLISNILSYLGGHCDEYVFDNLMGIFCSMPQNQMQCVMRHLEAEQVPLKILRRFLHSNLLTFEDIKRILHGFGYKYENLKLQADYVRVAFHLFKTHRSKGSFELFKSILMANNNKKLLQRIIGVIGVYRLPFEIEIVKLLWNVVNASKIEPVDEYVLKTRLISLMKPHVRELPYFFSYTVISNLFLKFQDKIKYDGSDINALVNNFIFEREEQNRIDPVSDSVYYAYNFRKDLRKKCGQSIETEINKFLKDFCSKCVDSYICSGAGRKIIVCLITRLLKILPVYLFFDKYVFLQMLTIAYTAQHPFPDNYAREINTYIGTCIKKYDTYLTYTYIPDIVAKIAVCFTFTDDPNDSKSDSSATNTKLEEAKIRLVVSLSLSGPPELNNQIIIKLLEGMDLKTHTCKKILNYLKQIPVLSVPLRFVDFFTSW